MTESFQTLALIGGYVIVGLIGLLGLTIVLMIWTGRINLAKLIAEENGDASLSRFQLLIFTFVVATSLLLLVLDNMAKASGVAGFPSISPEVLGLIGISSGSYVLAKGIQKNFDATKQAEAPPKDGETR